MLWLHYKKICFFFACDSEASTLSTSYLYYDPGNEIYTSTAPNTFQYLQAGGLRTDVSIDGSDQVLREISKRNSFENSRNLALFLKTKSRILDRNLDSFSRI